MSILTLKGLQQLYMLSNICSYIYIYFIFFQKALAQFIFRVVSVYYWSFSIGTRIKFIIVVTILMIIWVWNLSRLLAASQPSNMSNFEAIGNFKPISHGFYALQDLVVRHRNDKCIQSRGLVQPEWPYPFPSLWTSYWKSGMSLWSHVYFGPLKIVRDSFIGPTGIAVIGYRLVVFGDVGSHGLWCTNAAVMYHILLYIVICAITELFCNQQPWNSIYVAFLHIFSWCYINIYGYSPLFNFANNLDNHRKSYLYKTVGIYLQVRRVGGVF